MTTPSTRLDRDRPLTTDQDLAEHLGRLLEQAFNPRQLWLLFVDTDDRLNDVIMPCDDYPRDPDEPIETDDLGLTDFAHVLARRLSEVVDLTGAASVVLVWERPGTAAFARDEITWARAMSEACRDSQVRLRAQFVLHDDGIRILTPDDFTVASADR